MDDFYNTNDNFPPEVPPFHESSSGYEGSPSHASAALILGILSLLSICCMPPLAIVFAGLSLILGVLSKGERTRPQNARIGMILSGISFIAVVIILAVFLIRFTSTSTNSGFLKQYLDIMEHPDHYSEDDIYDFIEDYLYPNDNSQEIQPYDYNETPYDGSDGYDYYYEQPSPYHEDSEPHNVI